MLPSKRQGKPENELIVSSVWVTQNSFQIPFTTFAAFVAYLKFPLRVSIRRITAVVGSRCIHEPISVYSVTVGFLPTFLQVSFDLYLRHNVSPIVKIL